MRAALLPIALLVLAACGGERAKAAPAPPAVRPSILLVTLDTTRADAIGPEAAGIRTPAFDAVAARGTRFRQAYAAVPETLPSHVSMMTGVYPASHAVHENARPLAATQPLAAERLQQAGYRTAAFCPSPTVSPENGLGDGGESEGAGDGHGADQGQAVHGRVVLLVARRQADRVH